MEKESYLAFNSNLDCIWFVFSKIKSTNQEINKVYLEVLSCIFENIHYSSILIIFNHIISRYYHCHIKVL